MSEHAVNIQILGPMSEEQAVALSETQAFNAPFDVYYNAQLKACTEGLNESELAEFNRWRNEGANNAGMSEKANNAILAFICAGCT